MESCSRRVVVSGLVNASGVVLLLGCIDRLGCALVDVES